MSFKIVGEEVEQAEIQLSEEEERTLWDAAVSLMKKNPKKASILKSLFHTENTMANSLSSIVRYLLDPGTDLYVPAPVYNPSKDCIRLEIKASDKLAQIQKICSGIQVSDKSPYDMATRGYLLLDTFRKNSDSPSPTLKTIARILQLVLGKEPKGAYFSSPDRGIGYDILSAVVSMWIIQGKGDACCISGSSDGVITAWREKDSPDFLNNFLAIENCSLLAIDGLDKLPFGRPFLIGYLIPLFNARKQKGLVNVIYAGCDLDDAAGLIEFSRDDRETLKALVKRDTEVLPEVVDLRM